MCFCDALWMEGASQLLTTEGGRERPLLSKWHKLVLSILVVVTMVSSVTASCKSMCISSDASKFLEFWIMLMCMHVLDQLINTLLYLYNVCLMREVIKHFLPWLNFSLEKKGHETFLLVILLKTFQRCNVDLWKRQKSKCKGGLESHCVARGSSILWQSTYFFKNNSFGCYKWKKKMHLTIQDKNARASLLDQTSD